MNEKEHKATIRTVPIDRAVPNGFDLLDFIELTSRINNNEVYRSVCFEIGERNKAKAETALANKKNETAKLFFLNASAAFRVGQYTIIPDNQEKLCAYTKLIQCYKKAASLFNPSIERVVIPYKENEMVGWLRMPQSMNKPVPVVISIGGADGWREEHHNYSDFYIERGMAYLMIDGPGQGETRLFNKLYMKLDNEQALYEIVEHISKDHRFDNIGLIGYSFGGYLAARGASVIEKLKACVINGGSYMPKEILTFLPHFHKVFSALSGRDGDKLSSFINGMSMEGFAQNIRCPLLIIHGKKDPLFSWKGVQRIYDEARSKRKDIMLWDDGNHCVTNHGTEVITSISDWFAETLK